MCAKTYTNTMKKKLALNIDSSKTDQFGRTVAPALMDMEEVQDGDEINFSNCVDTMKERVYNIKFPWLVLRALAGSNPRQEY